MMKMGNSHWLGAAVSAVAVTTPVAALAQEQSYSFDIPAQDLGSALRQFAQVSRQQVSFNGGLVRGKTSSVLKGRYPATDGLAVLLRGTGLSVRRAARGVLVIQTTPVAREEAHSRSADDSSLERADEIVVTGSRIRGTPPTVPVISTTGAEMRDAGQNDLGEFVRSLPESFSGGQNPGVGISAGNIQNQNLNSSSAPNLRGLGPDATLTLFNGHRMPYDGARQGIDISAIPLTAVDRVEIVADGASALYGSDAVGGVANVILKRSFDGVEASARIGTSTEGGGLEREASLVAGTTWNAGGFIATYDFEKDSGLLAGDRAITSSLNPSRTVLLPTERHSAAFAGHVAIADGVELSADGFYNHRDTTTIIPSTATAPYTTTGRDGWTRARTWAVAPSLRVEMGGSWSLNAQAVYGKSRTDYGSTIYSRGAVSSRTQGCYCNAAWSVEAGIEGPLFDAPGGPVRLALGAGYRWNELRAFRTIGVAQNIDASQGTYFAYGEAALPLISPDQEVKFLNRVLITGALRYENYPGIQTVVTPKIGAIISPTQDFDIKGSWGKSFKAPTLYQLYSPQYALYDYAAYYSAGTVPSGATVLELTGGNRNLKPERATTWTTTLDVHPRSLPGLDIELSYFSVDYRDRIVQPITYLSVALSDARYSDLITLNPNDAAKSAALNSADFIDYTDEGYNSANVYAIVNNLYLNVSRQRLHGLDLHVRYRHALPAC